MMSYHQPFEMSAIAQLLLTLRPGSMDTVQLQERYGDRMPTMARVISDAIRLGYVTKVSTGDAQHYRYSLTDEGRRACPSRRTVRAMDFLYSMRDMEAT